MKHENLVVFDVWTIAATGSTRSDSDWPARPVHDLADVLVVTRYGAPGVMVRLVRKFRPDTHPATTD